MFKNDLQSTKKIVEGQYIHNNMITIILSLVLTVLFFLLITKEFFFSPLFKDIAKSTESSSEVHALSSENRKYCKKLFLFTKIIQYVIYSMIAHSFLLKLLSLLVEENYIKSNRYVWLVYSIYLITLVFLCKMETKSFQIVGISSLTIVYLILFITFLFNKFAILTNPFVSLKDNNNDKVRILSLFNSNTYTFLISNIIFQLLFCAFCIINNNNEDLNICHNLYNIACLELKFFLSVLSSICVLILTIEYIRKRYLVNVHGILIEVKFRANKKIKAVIILLCIINLLNVIVLYTVKNQNQKLFFLGVLNITCLIIVLLTALKTNKLKINEDLLVKSNIH